MNNQGIGYIDSGFGGLTVVDKAFKLIPNEKIFFIGDQARVPYGNRKNNEIIKFVFQMTNFLVQEKKIKLLVIACNTISAHAIPALKKKLKIPIIGIIHAGAKSAIKASDNGLIDIIGTNSTISSNVYVKQIKKINPSVTVFQRSMQKFVSLVESGAVNNDETQKIVYKNFYDWFQIHPLASKADVLLLGCTHFPILIDRIRKVVGKEIKIVDPAISEVLYVKKVLQENDLLRDKNLPVNPKNNFLYTTGNLKKFSYFAIKWFNFKNFNFKKLLIGKKKLIEKI